VPEVGVVTRKAGLNPAICFYLFIPAEVALVVEGLSRESLFSS